mgnify:CR=1 FL=1
MFDSSGWASGILIIGAVFGIVLSVAGHGCVSCASKYRIVPAATAPGKEP